MNELMSVLRAIPRPARWLTTFFLFAGLAYALGRLLRLGNKSWMLLVGVLVICAALGLFEIFRHKREKKRSREFEGSLGLHSRKSEVGKEEIREALAELSEKWQTSVAQLREAGMSIYSLPWYLLIGEPQSGKSTTLKNSGLEFPVGAEALSGSGGTRNCDWWFSNEAVILDTAGRFTFQEESAPDQHEWAAFLKLIRKHRKYCPINGIIVVIPATSLVEDAPEEQEKKAKNIRQKLLHLQKVLEIRFPIFILVTKADRILGFTEFFSKLDPADQRQLFGWSTPGAPEEAWDLKSFSEVFDGIVERVHKQRMRFLKDEDNLPLVDKLFVFPEELEAIREPLAGYFHAIFASNRFEEPFLFRGFYLTSGVQQGRPIARACRDLLRVQVGDPQGVLEDLEQVFNKSRAYFIRDFYEKKLFPEQGLIARTRAALKKDRNYRYAMYGLTGGLVAVIVPLLMIGGLNLYRVIGPINQSAQGAKRCLGQGGAQPCEVGFAYGLIRDFEKHKQAVREAKWTMRTFLKSAERNEISESLVPAIQAELFERNVLAPVLASFEARSQGFPWERHQKDYETFHAAYQNLLRFRRLAGAASGEDLAGFLQDLRIAPLLAFSRAAAGRDPQGRSLDEWLRGDVNLEQADKIFRDAMGTRPDLSGLSVPEGRGAHEAFRGYWTVRNLAHWDARTDEHLRTYRALYEEMLGLAAPLVPPAASPEALPSYTAPPAPAPIAPTVPAPAVVPVANPGAADPYGAALGTAPPAALSPQAPAVPTAGPILARFADLAQRFAKNFAEGEAHMRSERQAAGSRRPGLVADWEGNCRSDYEALAQIAPIAREDEIATHCRTIPGDYAALDRTRQQYAYLYQTKVEGPRAVMTWSADAARVTGPLVDLGALAAPQQVAADEQAFRRVLQEQNGSLARLTVIADTSRNQSQRIFAPVAALAEMAGLGAPPPAPPAPPGGAAPSMPGGAVPAPAPAAPPLPVAAAFRLQDGLARAREIASLNVALRVLPPAADFFASAQAFGLDCSGCFYLKHAEDHVPPANDFLRWARLTLAPAAAQPEVRAQIDRIDQAEFAYLEEFIAQQRWGGGGGGGAGGPAFVVPVRAGQARSWRDFVRTIRGWEPVVERSGGGAPPPPAVVSSGGLTAEALERFVAGNDSLRQLLGRFRERSQSAAAASAAASSRPAPRLSQDLVGAAETFKSCVAGLEEEALRAWRQLALQRDGTSLADFHAFTGSLRLRGNPSAARMASIETHGARLMAQEIRPAFDARLLNLWSIAGSCCNNRYPFISRARLQGQRESYEEGPRGSAGPWTPPVRDAAQRSVTQTLQLETVSLDSLDRLFFEGGSLDSLYEEFVIEPIVDGREKAVDFVGGNKDRLRVLRQWQRFVYGDGRSSASQQVKVKLLAGASTAPRIFLGERMGQIDIFGPYAVRPSTDAARVRILTMPLLMEDRPVSIIGRNEDRTGGWSGVLSLRGGPLKIPYFLHLASQGRPREGGRVWTVRMQLPDYQQPQQRLEGVFELTFERPLPEIVPGAQLDGP